MNNKIPATIISGFLGSGKTTFLNHVLSNNKGIKFAVVENEFGSINIDQELIASKDDDIVEMTNGCICCEIKEDLIKSLVNLLQKKHSIDHLLIETTGVADPGPIIQSLLRDNRIFQAYEIDNVLSMVDALNFEKQLGIKKEAKTQVAFSSVVLINKTDLVSEEKLDQIRNTVESINPMAKVYETVNGNVNLSNILNQRYFEKSHIHNMSFEESHHHNHDHGHNHSHDHHTSDIQSIVVNVKGNLNPAYFQLMLGPNLLTGDTEIYRMKGFLSYDGEPKRLIFQAVMDNYFLEQDRDWRSDEVRENKVVVIGKNLSKSRFENFFKKALVSKDRCSQLNAKLNR